MHPGRGAARGGDRRPSWASCSLQRLRDRESVSRGLLRSSPRSGLSVSRALAGFRLPKPLRACFIPVTLLGFDLQGFSLPQGRTPLDAPSSLAVAKLTTPSRTSQTRSASEVCSLRESVPPASREARSTADTLLASYPLGRFVLLPRHRLPGASSPVLGRSQPQSHNPRALQSFHLQEARHFSLAGAPAPLGFATSSRGPPCGCLAFR